MKGGGDLLVRAPFGDQFGDASFGGREFTGGGCASADPAELGLGALRPERRAEVVEEALRLREGRAGRPPLPRAPLYRPEGEQRTRSFKWKWQRLHSLQRLNEGFDRAVLVAGADCQ